MELRFLSDTKHRKQWFTGISFSHPAKMSLPLQLWLIENYTKEGETILDPMAGSGTLMVACSMGRNVLLIELEQKFCEMMEKNWEKVKQRGNQMGYEMGTCQIIQGDSRNLENILCDKIITSPPYAEGLIGKGLNNRQVELFIKTGKGHFSKGMKIENYRDSLPQAYSDNPNNIGNLPYGQVDKIDSIITSPPYEGTDVSQTHMTSDQRGDPSNPNYRPSWKRKLDEGYAKSKRPYADAIISSPPYEEAMGDKHHSPRADKLAGEKRNPVTYTDKVDAILTSPPYAEQTLPKNDVEKELSGGIFKGRSYRPGNGYSANAENIGNLKSTSYLEAMLVVYRSCFSVLKDGGLMILVVKNFLRNQKEVDLKGDTRSLCEQAGFRFVEEHHRLLSSQSFWRTIYYQKYPTAPKIDKEYILVFQRIG